MLQANSPAAAIRAAAEAYFQDCDNTRERVVLKNGELTYHQVPYTMAGLCARLGISRETLERARGHATAPTRKRGRQCKEEVALREVYCWAATRVEQHVVERALLGELNASVAGMLLKDWGYGGEEHRRDDTLSILLEDSEGLSR